MTAISGPETEYKKPVVKLSEDELEEYKRHGIAHLVTDTDFEFTIDLTSLRAIAQPRFVSVKTKRPRPQFKFYSDKPRCHPRRITSLPLGLDSLDARIVHDHSVLPYIYVIFPQLRAIYHI